MFFSDEQATVTVRSLYGPPRPVLVVTITGEIDRANEMRLLDIISDTITIAVDGARSRSRFGSRNLSSALVLDLREATFVAVRTLHDLVDQAERRRQTQRFVVNSSGIVNRALRLLDSASLPAVYADLADAVLADVVVSS